MEGSESFYKIFSDKGIRIEQLELVERLELSDSDKCTNTNYN